MGFLARMFGGGSPMTTIDRLEVEQEEAGRAAYLLASIALRRGMADSGLVVRLPDTTDNRGRAWGSWEITVKRTATPCDSDRNRDGEKPQALSAKHESAGRQASPNPDREQINGN